MIQWYIGNGPMVHCEWFNGVLKSERESEIIFNENNCHQDPSTRRVILFACSTFRRR